MDDDANVKVSFMMERRFPRSNLRHQHAHRISDATRTAAIRHMATVLGCVAEGSIT